MKRPSYSLHLAPPNVRRAGRMSEQSNCFPFLRKVNGPLIEHTAISPAYGSDDTRRSRTAMQELPSGIRAILRVPLRKGDLISFMIDLSARRRNSVSGFSARSRRDLGHEATAGAAA